MENLISFIVLGAEASDCKELWKRHEAARPHVYRIKGETLRSGDSTSLLFSCDPSDQTHFNIMDLETPWVLLLAKDEYLSHEQWKNLRGSLGTAVCNKPLGLWVERFMGHDILKKYAWVTTREWINDPPEELNSHLLLEIRLYPLSSIKDDPSWLYALNNEVYVKGTLNSLAATSPNGGLDPFALVSREYSGGGKVDKDPPTDAEIYRSGHERFFDDSVFCEGFAWPHSVYHTIRSDYIPGIIEGLKRGLGNAQIALYSLVYLIRYWELEKASEIVDLIPEHWHNRAPLLLNAMGAVCFATKDYNRALGYFSKAFHISPHSKLTASNLAKIHILSENDEALRALDNKYRDLNGCKLDDDFLIQYRKIREQNKLRSATLSLCMVVKDEEKNIARAIQSVMESVDEVIITDTGSKDRTVDIAKGQGAKVIVIPWHNDFSEARNEALRNATCDYVLFLDGDEYFPPFHAIDLQVFKKSLPLAQPTAFNLAIGKYYNDTDWLFLAREKGNFKPENRRIRILPRLEGVSFEGKIEETPKASLDKLAIPMSSVSEEALHIVHDQPSRKERIRRKAHIYWDSVSPAIDTILAAIRDFSTLGDRDATLFWLKRYFEDCDSADMTRKIKSGLHIGRLLEGKRPREALSFYKELLGKSQDHPELTLAAASFYLRSDRLELLRDLNFDTHYSWDEKDASSRLRYSCFISLKHFLISDRDKALAILISVLEELPAHTLGQALRFYYLTDEMDLDGALSALDYLFEILMIKSDKKIDSIEGFLGILFEMTEELQKEGYHEERALIFRGALTLEEKLK